MVEPTKRKPRRFRSLRIGFGSCSGRMFRRRQGILLRFSAHKSPDVSVEAAELFLYSEECLRVRNRRVNLQPVANDSRIAQQFPNLSSVVRRNPLRFETIKRLTIIFAFLENRLPA